MATGVAVSAAVVLAVSGAQAAVKPGWRYAAVYEIDEMTSVSASGTANAWAVGQTFDEFPCGNPCLFASHWNGKKWQRIPVPVLPVGDNPDVGGASVAAITGGRAWVFATQTNGEMGTSDEVAIEWTGTSWSAAQQLPGLPSGPIASGPDDVWGFENDNGIPRADHYNGKTWSQVPIPVFVSSASGTAAAGDWVMGTLAAQPGRAEVLHWGNGAWRSAPLPKISVPKGDHVSAGFIAPALSPASVWATLSVSTAKGAGQATILLHWNGKAWSTVPVPKALSTYIHGWAGISGLASDSRGGVWVASYTVRTIDDFKGLAMYHYSGGRWTHVLVPVRSGFNTKLSGGMELIPGTRSVLAPVTLVGLPRFNAAVLKYGP